MRLCGWLPGAIGLSMPYGMLQLEKLEVHFAEPLIVYKKHLWAHACVAQGCCAYILVLSTVHTIVTSWNHLNLRCLKSAVLTVLFHVAD